LSENFTYDMDELLVKYLLDEVSDEERDQVLQWVNQSEANKKQLEHFSLLWRESKKLESEMVADEDKAWRKFKTTIQTSATRAPLVAIKKRTNWLGRAAALVLVALGTLLALLLLRKNPLPSGELAYIQSADSAMVQTLSDGSIITLNKQSSITYQKQFTGSSRELALTGEAFFNVSPDKSKPFIIKVNDVLVKVVGTSFNIRSQHGRTEVIVETGVVEVIRQQKKLVLQAKEKTVIADSSTVLVKENVSNQLYQHYRTREFVCDNTPLWQLVQVLNETYSVSIVIADPSLRKLPLTATFHQESLEGVLEIVSKTLAITVVKEKDSIILTR
jgi:transmembrane sensor